jgi:drug/metabolite transporter (DMT)-like permease
MSISQILLIILCVVGISTGQILFKLAALSPIRGERPLAIAFELALNPYLLAGLTIYLAATVFWIWLLRQVPLNLAYPLMALAFLFVPILGAYILDEPFTRSTLIGGILIIGGVYVIVR